MSQQLSWHGMCIIMIWIWWSKNYDMAWGIFGTRASANYHNYKGWSAYVRIAPNFLKPKPIRPKSVILNHQQPALKVLPDSKVYGASMGPTWVLLAPGRPQKFCLQGSYILWHLVKHFGCHPIGKLHSWNKWLWKQLWKQIQLYGQYCACWWPSTVRC